MMLVIGGLIYPSCKWQEEEKRGDVRQNEFIKVKVVYRALEDFEYESKENRIPFYRDSLRNALAINAVK